ncbi:hypothetical protein PR003_g8335 [Phytophthora rubi]|uniref:Secreted protein n=1 Tax=Phytophthora rubi TaxID=129364 RepID=A0A6A4FBF8_9STRA|nr:hypothetical protein PR002_g8142 [Phytophthora rubi]KAE9052178.1 hypothetical protein PR001_g752 [Phytophthora rubi]KAE9344684.1 hypothetical protein PR003_g8335 [Phytophthora rubi]
MHIAALTVQTVVASVAFACNFMMHRSVRMNIFTLEPYVAFESMLYEECYNAWFCRHLRCSQTTFLLLCNKLRVFFPLGPTKNIVLKGQ